MILRWHVPGFVTGSDLQGRSMDFATEADLLAHPVIQGWMRDPMFAEWKVAPYGGEHLLMAIHRSGKFWVVGYLPSIEGLSFPELPERP